MSKAIFLDRDGVINVDVPYLHDVKDFVFVPGVVDFLAQAQNFGYLLFVVTNQSGIGRGLFDYKDYVELTAYMVRELSFHGIQLTEVVHCPHEPSERCVCRKPSGYLVDLLCDKYKVTRNKSMFIGDKISDVQCGKNANLGLLYLLESRYHALTVDPDFTLIKSFEHIQLNKE